MTLDSSELIFQALEPLQPQWPLQPQQPQWSHDLDSLISLKFLLILMVGSSLAPKWSKSVLFCGMDHQNPIFYWYLTPFLSKAVEASRCYFFENWLLKIKFPNLLKPLGTIIQQKYWSFYPSEPFSFVHFNMIHLQRIRRWK
jgi:hypothetical protein